MQQGSGSAQAACSQYFQHAENFAQLSKGDVFFVPCDTVLQVSTSERESLLLWMASVNSQVFEQNGRQGLAENGHAAADVQASEIEKRAEAII